MDVREINFLYKRAKIEKNESIVILIASAIAAAVMASYGFTHAVSETSLIAIQVRVVGWGAFFAFVIVVIKQAFRIRGLNDEIQKYTTLLSEQINIEK